MPEGSRATANVPFKIQPIATGTQVFVSLVDSTQSSFAGESLYLIRGSIVGVKLCQITVTNQSLISIIHVLIIITLEFIVKANEPKM